MKSVAFIAAAAAIATVSAQTDEGRLFYTSPTAATVWTAGKNETVSWSNVCRPENTGRLNIVLYQGTGGKNGTEQSIVPGIEPIGTLNCLTDKSATVFLPANLTTSNKYAIHVDTEPLQSYSAPFTINGVAPPATVAPTTPGASTTGAPSSTTTAGETVPSAGAGQGDSNSAAGSLKVVGSTVAMVAAAFGALLL